MGKLDVFDDVFLEQYRKDNYEIKVNHPKVEGKVCYIYFSGNGLYDPNTVEAFESQIVQKDRYEWARWKANKSHMDIFVRDLHKAWYAYGINETLNTIDKVYDFLKEVTQGYKVITVGCSAGGYMATLMGCLLKAERVYGFSSQYSIKESLSKLHWLDINTLPSKYFDLLEVIQANQATEIYHFTSSHVEMDKVQTAMVMGLPNVYVFNMKSKLHGKSVYSNNLIKLLDMTAEDIRQLNKAYKHKKIGQLQFSIKLVGIRKSLVGYFYTSMKPVYYKLNDHIRSKACKRGTVK